MDERVGMNPARRVVGAGVVTGKLAGGVLAAIWTMSLMLEGCCSRARSRLLGSPRPMLSPRLPKKLPQPEIMTATSTTLQLVVTAVLIALLLG